MSIETQHFDKAPIVEAIIGVELAEMLGDDSLNALKEFGVQLQPSYPTSEDMRLGEYEFRLGSQPKQTDTHIGFFFKSGDGRQVVHARRNGFGFSRLAPYQNWDQFFEEAKRTWSLYRRAIGPSSLSRWTVRYINKLVWPEGERMGKYLRIYPQIPDDLPQEIQGCFMRLEFPVPAPQGLLTQQLILLPPEQAGRVAFMLDNEFTFSAIGLRDSTLWDQIHSARDIKNSFFVNSITDEMKELIS
jgi:uncharacterized protein (TIGR04255 family)